MHLLIIEHDIDLQDSLCNFFKTLPCSVDVTPCGEHGNYLGSTKQYDCILLDHHPLKKNAHDIVKDLRKKGTMIPIIILSTLQESISKIPLFEAGIDDYLVKPFCFKELNARIKAIMRRPREIQPSVINLPGLTVDTDRHIVILGRQKFYLTRKEFDLLEYLARNSGCVISKSKLLEHVWCGDGDLFSNTIEAHILNIRKKMRLEKGKLIHTIPGRGYKLETTKP